MTTERPKQMDNTIVHITIPIPDYYQQAVDEYHMYFRQWPSKNEVIDVLNNQLELLRGTSLAIDINNALHAVRQIDVLTWTKEVPVNKNLIKTIQVELSAIMGMVLAYLTVKQVSLL